MDKSIVPDNQLVARSSTCYEFSNSNPAEVVEIEDEDNCIYDEGTVEKQMEDLKLDHQFNEKDVPEVFKTLINERMNGLKKINLGFDYSKAVLVLDDIHIIFEKMNDDGIITYRFNTAIKTVDPEKSIIDHLWFVLKNPNIKLETFGFLHYTFSKRENQQILDLEKLGILLKAMLNSIDHQIQTNAFGCSLFNEDIYLSILKHVKPGTLSQIVFDISWKEEGNYQKMKEIVGTDQWKKAEIIVSHRVTTSEIDEFFQSKSFCMKFDSITPEDVLRVIEHAFNSSCTKNCCLSCKHKKYDIDAIIDFLQSQNDGSQITKVKPTDPQFKFQYEIINFGKRVQLVGKENYILISNN